MVGERGRVRKKVTVALLDLVKSSRDSGGGPQGGGGDRENYGQQ